MFIAMTKRILALLLHVFLNICRIQTRSYENYTLFSVVPTYDIHLDFLRRLEDEKYVDYIIWKHQYRLYDTVQVLVSPRQVDIFKDKVYRLNLLTEVVFDNVQEAFDKQSIGKYIRFKPETFTWDHYYSLEDIYQWLADLNFKFPKTTSMYNAGKTAEYRDMYVFAVKIAKNATGSVLIDAGLHGNEWITTSFVTYLIDYLIYADARGHEALEILNKQFHWYLVAVANPDGYKFTHTTDRLWRKNRNRLDNGIGVDLNRNFGYGFGQNGTSSNPKNNTYCGPQAFSEPETLVMSNIVQELNEKLKIEYYFSFHAYGQSIITPFDDATEQERKAASALFRHYGQKYRVGTPLEVLGYSISGDSASWVKTAYDVRYAYTYIMPDNGTYGHALPPTMIKRICKETLDGVAEIITGGRFALTGTEDKGDGKKGGGVDDPKSIKLGTLILVICIALLFAIIVILLCVICFFMLNPYLRY